MGVDIKMNTIRLQSQIERINKFMESDERRKELEGVTDQDRRAYKMPKPPSVEEQWTKRRPEMSEDAYVKAIEEQAKQDAENGTFHRSEGFRKIRQSFVSVVSPVRFGAVNEWNMAPTADEKARLDKFHAIYNDAFFKAKMELQGTVTQQRFDMRA